MNFDLQSISHDENDLINQLDEVNKQILLLNEKYQQVLQENQMMKTQNRCSQCIQTNKQMEEFNLQTSQIAKIEMLKARIEELESDNLLKKKQNEIQQRVIVQKDRQITELSRSIKQVKEVIAAKEQQIQEQQNQFNEIIREKEQEILKIQKFVQSQKNQSIDYSVINYQSAQQITEQMKIYIQNQGIIISQLESQQWKCFQMDRMQLAMKLEEELKREQELLLEIEKMKSYFQQQLCSQQQKILQFTQQKKLVQEQLI